MWTLLFSLCIALLTTVSRCLAERQQQQQFHAYLPLSQQQKTQKTQSSECQEMSAKHAKTDMRAVADKHKLWPGLIHSSHELKPQSTLYGLEDALDKIWTHQHPQDCSQAKFFISGNHNGGFGSELHVLGSALGLAMDMGRVYLQNPLVHDKVHWEVSNSYCQQQNTTNLECYYEPWSSCTIFDALGPNAIGILRSARNMEYPSNHKQVRSFMWTGDVNQLRDHNNLRNFNGRYEGNKAIILKTMGRLKYGLIPNSLWPIIECSPMNQSHAYYWWRAVSTSYIMRPNAKTQQWLNSHSLTDFSSDADNAIGMYVRRGDKEIEMRIAPLKEYIDAIDYLWKNDYMTDFVSDPKAKRALFLASEDSKVIDDMTAWQKKGDYKMVYTKIFDRHGLFAEKSANERRQHVGETHHPDEYLSMMLNVHYLLRSTAWICTMSSNFCRVIDELRATSAAKADHPYLDLSVETCSKPPCVYTNMKYFDWR